MVILWTIIALVVLFLSVCLIILTTQAREVERMEAYLKETLWTRRNLLPLLIEVVTRSLDHDVGDSRKRMIELRDKAGSSAFKLAERMELEKQLTPLITQLVSQERENKLLKTDALFLSLKKELEESLETIRRATNDYNFAVQKWKRYCGMPWFKIFEFAFQIKRNEPLRGA